MMPHPVPLPLIHVTAVREKAETRAKDCFQLAGLIPHSKPPHRKGTRTKRYERTRRETCEAVLGWV